MTMGENDLGKRREEKIFRSRSFVRSFVRTTTTTELYLNSMTFARYLANFNRAWKKKKEKKGERDREREKNEENEETPTK